MSPAPADAPASSSAAGITREWPGAMVALGHSGLTGYQSDGGLFDVPANSWATGTNPAVDSVYLRILAANPAIDGNAANFAVDGADVDELAFQASRERTVRRRRSDHPAARAEQDRRPAGFGRQVL